MNRKESVSARLRTAVLPALALATVLGFLASGSADARDEPLGTFRNTYYYMVFESDFADEPKEADILTMNGDLIAKVTAKFYKALLMEGSGHLNDDRIVNWAGKVDGKSRFHITPLEWGRGTGSCALSPFRTIAADPAQIPPGAVVRIEETIGMLLPDGTRSDGVWLAEDTGSAILHDRIDLFIGRRSSANFLQKAGITHLQPLTITLLDHPLPDSCVFKIPE